MAVQHIERPGISRNIYFLTIALVAVVGFAAGTRGDDIIAAVGPMFGFAASPKTIDLSAVERTYQNLKANYDGTLDTKKLIDGASRGLVAAAGDQFTVFMDAQEAAAFNNDLSGNIGGGIGAEIGVRSSKPTVIRVLPGNPAEKAGVMVGDVITAVDGTDATTWAADATAGKIRGDVGTPVKLTVLRGTETKTFTITRATVTDPSVSSSVSNGIGTMTITRFDDQTGDLARQAAQSFKQQNVKSVILDLRDNGGGYLTAAQVVAGLWLNDQAVVSERTGGKVVDELKSGNDAILAGLPTVVLVNGDSASASEIVAGALQDHKAATLIGEKTYGKGTVQKVLDLGAGTVLKVTIARWYTPNGKNIDKQGITPNQTVGLTAADADAGRDPQLDAAMKQLGL
jgi:carboxyl-terminal processing protease